jgi:hypothetical protein
MYPESDSIPRSFLNRWPRLIQTFVRRGDGFSRLPTDCLESLCFAAVPIPLANVLVLVTGLFQDPQVLRALGYLADKPTAQINFGDLAGESNPQLSFWLLPLHSPQSMARHRVISLLPEMSISAWHQRCSCDASCLNEPRQVEHSVCALFLWTAIFNQFSASIQRA